MTFRESAPGLFGALRLVVGDITFEDDEVEIEDLAAGDVVIMAWAHVTEGFDAGSTNVLVLGDGTTADKFLAAADVTEATPGIYPTGGKGPFVPEAAAGVLTAGYTQTGDAAEAGAARIYALISRAPA